MTATLLDGLMSIEIDGVINSRYEHWCGMNPKFAKYLRLWGEAGTVKTKTTTTPKVKDRGVPCMMIGYALEHPGDTYRMWNPDTNGVHQSRNVIWMKRMYYQKKILSNEITTDGDIEFQTPATPKDGEGTIIEEPEKITEEQEESEDEKPEDTEEMTVEPEERRRSERISQPTQRLIEETGLKTGEYEIALTQAEVK